MTLPRRLCAEQSDAERARWRVVRLDTYATLDGEIVAADADSGLAVMRERGPDEIASDGSRKATYRQVTHNFGPGGMAIVARR
jgi:hypothetical protein